MAAITFIMIPKTFIDQQSYTSVFNRYPLLKGDREKIHKICSQEERIFHQKDLLLWGASKGDYLLYEKAGNLFSVQVLEVDMGGEKDENKLPRLLVQSLNKWVRMPASRGKVGILAGDQEDYVQCSRLLAKRTSKPLKKKYDRKARSGDKQTIKELKLIVERNKEKQKLLQKGVIQEGTTNGSEGEESEEMDVFWINLNEETHRREVEVYVPRKITHNPIVGKFLWYVWSEQLNIGLFQVNEVKYIKGNDIHGNTKKSIKMTLDNGQETMKGKNFYYKDFYYIGKEMKNIINHRSLHFAARHRHDSTHIQLPINILDFYRHDSGLDFKTNHHRFPSNYSNLDLVRDDYIVGWVTANQDQLFTSNSLFISLVISSWFKASEEMTLLFKMLSKFAYHKWTRNTDYSADAIYQPDKTRYSYEGQTEYNLRLQSIAMNYLDSTWIELPNRYKEVLSRLFFFFSKNL